MMIFPIFFLSLTRCKFDGSNRPPWPPKFLIDTTPLQALMLGLTVVTSRGSADVAATAAVGVWNAVQF